MRNKNRNRANETGSTAVLDSSNVEGAQELPTTTTNEGKPLSEWTREELLAKLTDADPEGISSALEMSDEGLRELVQIVLDDPEAGEDVVLESSDDAVAEVPATEPIVEVVPEAPVTEQPAVSEPPVAEVPATIEPAAQQETPATTEVVALDLSGIPESALKVITTLMDEINKLKARGPGRKVASGSTPRPNVVYTLLAKPPAWHNTPQVAQLEQILFAPEVAAKFTVEVQGKPTVQIKEPDMFALIEDGKTRGVLRTRQPAVRIFQYYRSDLIAANVLVQQ